jgi:catechol 2,3-dioxygenase-like lactoylglutathione lyase family enzyme
MTGPRTVRFLVAAVLAVGVLSPPPAHAAEYDHIHIAVGSPSEAVRWYVEHMECREIPDRTDAADCGNIRISFGAQPTVGGSPGTGVDHIAFSFADLESKMAALERAGVGGRGVRLQRFDDGSTLRDDGLFTHGFVFDPWGTRIELVEDLEYPGFHHVHLSSTDPEAALDWYQEALGGERAQLAELLDGLRFDNVWLLVSTHAEGTPASTDGRAIDHLGFLVSDIDEAGAGFSARGIPFLGDPEPGRTAARRAFIAGPDNVRLAVVEPGWAPADSRLNVAGNRLNVEALEVDANEPYVVGRTPWGAPDLQGIWTSNRAHGIPLERPRDAEDIEELTPEEAAARRERGTLQSIWGYEREWRDTTLGFVDDLPSTQIAMVIDPSDGRIPPLTPEAEARSRGGFGGRGGPPAGPEDLSNYVRCITQGLPGLMMPTIYNNGLQIVQSPDHVVILKEMIHEARVIPIESKPSLGEDLRQWLGDSRGHWEGDTLVVEVTNFNGREQYRSSGETLRLVERYTRIGPNTIEYRFTVDDPETWTRPWTAMFRFDRDDEQYELVEYACHEGNYAMRNILSAARAREAAGESDEGGN